MLCRCCFVNIGSYLVTLVDEVCPRYISKKQLTPNVLLTKPLPRWIARLQRF